MRILLLSMVYFLLIASDSVWSQTLSWSDLLPELAPMDDPFMKLTPDQIYLLSMVNRYKEIESLNDEQLSNKKEISDKLESQGVNIDKLLARRGEIEQERMRRAATVNNAVLGATSKIPGFIVPLHFNGTLVTQFFLVPTAGACIHTPPPPPNQIVLVEYPKGIEIPSLYEAFWVRGDLKQAKSALDVNYSDGFANVQSVYKIDAESVEHY